MATVRSYPVIVPDRSKLPHGLFDPRWAERDVAARVAFELYRRIRHLEPELEPVGLSQDLEPLPESSCTTERFELVAYTTEEIGARMKGGAFNELHRRYAYGGTRPTANFHAKVIVFGVDAEGRWFVRASVGRWGGVSPGAGALSVRFYAGDAFLGEARWSGGFPQEGDAEARIGGRDDAAIASRFDAITHADVTFSAAEVDETKSHALSEAVADALDIFGS